MIKKSEYEKINVELTAFGVKVSFSWTSVIILYFNVPEKKRYGLKTIIVYSKVM